MASASVADLVVHEVHRNRETRARVRSKHYGQSPDAVLKLHGDGGFLGLHGRVRLKGKGKSPRADEPGNGGAAKSEVKGHSSSAPAPTDRVRKPASRSTPKTEASSKRGGGGGRGKRK